MDRLDANGRRVVFYSVNDLSSRGHLIHADRILSNSEWDNSNINDLLELYNIKLYFDHDVLLFDDWSRETIQSHRNKVSQIWPIITVYYSKIDDTNIIEIYEKVQREYLISFWTVINKFRTYEKISSEVFNCILKSERFYLSQILRFKGLVDYFSDELSEFMKQHPVQAAEELLSHYEAKKIFNNTHHYFPKFTESDYERIFQDYLKSETVNLNYVRLIQSARNLKLNDRLRHEAKKMADKLNDEVLEKGYVFQKRFIVSISGSQDDLVKVKKIPNASGVEYSYSKKTIDDNLNPVGAMLFFERVFLYMTNQGCINLVSFSSEIDPFERVMMQSKNDYYVTAKFLQKNMLSSAQLIAYSDNAKSMNFDLEDLIASFVNDYLNEEFGINGIKIQFPSKDTKPKEKFRSLAPELDFLLKQYDSFVENGAIDFDFIRFSSSPIFMGAVKSKLDNKYYRGSDDHDLFWKIKNLFFSDQSPLHTLTKFDSEYTSFFDVLQNEEVHLNDFEEYQKLAVDILIEEGYLKDTHGRLIICNPIRVFILGVIHAEDCISYWHYPNEVRQEIDNLVKEGLLVAQEGLFTIEERQYLNFVLNKKEFANSLDLRNKYLHGTNTDSEDDHARNYLLLIRTLILIVLKIHEDLLVNRFKELETS